jgi:hypothetical protein
VVASPHPSPHAQLAFAGHHHEKAPGEILMGSLASQSALLAEDGVQVAASQQLKARPLQMFHDKGNKVFSSVFPIPQTVRSAATLTSNILDKKWCLVLTTTRQNPCHHLRLCDNFRKSVLT